MTSEIRKSGAAGWILLPVLLACRYIGRWSAWATESLPLGSRRGAGRRGLPAAWWASAVCARWSSRSPRSPPATVMPRCRSGSAAAPSAEIAAAAETHAAVADRCRCARGRPPQPRGRKPSSTMPGAASSPSNSAPPINELIAAFDNGRRGNPASPPPTSARATRTCACAPTSAADAAADAARDVEAVARAARELLALIARSGREVAAAKDATDRTVDDLARTDRTVRSLAAAAERIGTVVKLIEVDRRPDLAAWRSMPPSRRRAPAPPAAASRWWPAR